MVNKFREIVLHLNGVPHITMVADIVWARFLFVDVAVPHHQKHLVLVDEFLQGIVGEFGVVVAAIASTPTVEEVDDWVSRRVVLLIGLRAIDPVGLLMSKRLAEVDNVLIRMF